MSHAHHLWASAALILIAVLYLRACMSLRRHHSKPIDGWHIGSFLVGVLLIWVAVASPLAALDHNLLAAHMVQHLLLMTLAPPLVWIGAPLNLLHGLRQEFRSASIRLFRSATARRVGRALTHPALFWLGATATLVGWHVPAAFMFGLHSEIWHGIEQASFLTSGLVFWWPVVQSWPSATQRPKWSMLLYLFLATLPCDILSGFLVFCDRVIYPVYLSAPRPFAMSALEDQQCAGALMWTCVTVVYLIAGTIFTAHLLSPPSSRAYSFVESDSHVSVVPSTARQKMEFL
jgi:putative membrane protein